MRADGVVALAVAAFGVSFIAGMQTGGEPSKAKAQVTEQVGGERVTLADADALPGLAVTPEPRSTPQPKPKKAKAKPKRKSKPAALATAPAVRVVVRRPAPVVRSAPAPAATVAPRPVSTPRPISTPRPVRTPVATATPAPTFDDQGRPNSGTFDDGGG
jgi:hypothetical protein